MVAEASAEAGSIALTLPEDKKYSTYNQQRFIILAEKEIVLTVWKITPIKRNFILDLLESTKEHNQRALCFEKKLQWGIGVAIGLWYSNGFISNSQWIWVSYFLRPPNDEKISIDSQRL
ncbi:hypothetical protein NPIL_584541 [Nephila pilipes]|uniref:Uncharacterized protein n=1 Tax=Nephila pilipes TaxID=299642 RepID=A0A8X6UG69_NEPPI|nr:hypothetical protein NPIL_584541 [Nephila pilipes]